MTLTMRLGLVACAASFALAKAGDEREPAVAAVRIVDVVFRAYYLAGRS